MILLANFSWRLQKRFDTSVDFVWGVSLRYPREFSSDQSISELDLIDNQRCFVKSQCSLYAYRIELIPNRRRTSFCCNSSVFQNQIINFCNYIRLNDSMGLSMRCWILRTPALWVIKNRTKFLVFFACLYFSSRINTSFLFPRQWRSYYISLCIVFYFSYFAVIKIIEIIFYQQNFLAYVGIFDVPYFNFVNSL